MDGMDTALPTKLHPLVWGCTRNHWRAHQLSEWSKTFGGVSFVVIKHTLAATIQLLPSVQDE